MLFWLTQWLQPYIHGMRVFQYLTFRSILAVMTALVIGLLLGPAMIRRLSRYKVGQVIREEGPKSHFSKAGTPTMGGALILIAIAMSTLLWSDLTNRYIWIVLGVTLGFGIIGLLDDYRKLVLKHNRGLPARWKFLFQALIGLGIASYLYYFPMQGASTDLLIPFVKNYSIALGWLFIPFVFFVIVGSSNAVNLTDGLDGLAIMPCVFIAIAFGIFSYVTGHVKFANYLDIPFIPGVGELSIFCGSLVGAGLAFLWFNTYPAQVFMGDVGSLGLGAGLGVLAVLVRQELVLFIMGGIFVLETISVILQVASFKLTGKRIFRMAPIHHHFELKGWPEPRVIVRFWIISFILVLFGLVTLKLR